MFRDIIAKVRRPKGLGGDIRTVFSMTYSVHNKLASKYQWYDRWHQKPYASKVHYSVLGLVLIVITSITALAAGQLINFSPNQTITQAATTINISGTCQLVDQSTNCANSEVVKVAINGALSGTTGSTSGGAWSINSISVNANDILTVFVDNIADANEANTVLTVAASPANITEILLYERHLVVGGATNLTLTNTDLSQYDNSVSGDEDIFFEVDASSNLTIPATSTSDATVNQVLYIVGGNTYQPVSAGGKTITAPNVIIASTAVLTADSNTITLTGTSGTPFIATGTFTANTSTVKYAGSSSVTVASTNYYNLEANSGALDAETKLLLHADGVNNSTTFTDSSTYARTMTANGAAKISTTQKKFGTASGYLVTNSFVTAPNSADWEFGSGDFTIDWWEYRTGTGTESAIIARDPTATYTPFIIGGSFSGGDNLVYMTSTGTSWDMASGKTMGTTNLNTWNHYAISRSGSNFYTFKNGVAGDSWSSSAAIKSSTALLSIGKSQGYFYTGYIDELRVSKGIARWTAPFTPPTSAYSLDLSSFSPAGTITSTNNFNMTLGTFTAGANNLVLKNLSQSGGTFVASAANSFTLSGDYNKTAGTFTDSGGTITFSGSGAQAITAGGTGTGDDFTNMIVTNASADGVTFNDSVTIAGTFTNTTASSKITFHSGSTYAFSAISINGGAVGTRIVLTSSTGGSPWNLNITAASPTASYVNVKDSNANVDIDATTGGYDSGGNTHWLFPSGNSTPTNDLLTFTNPYSTNIAIADDTTEWNFRALVTDADGPTNLTTVDIGFANSADSTTPYNSLRYRWTEATDVFSEVYDTQTAGTITSTSANSNASGNQWTLDFKIKINNSFLVKDTNYATELYSIDDSSASDTDDYTDKYQVTALSLTLDVDSATIAFGNLLPGSVVTGTTTTTVTTNYPNGYSLAASDGVAGSDSCLLHTDTMTRIADYAGTIAVPTSWTGTGLGISLYSATGKDTSKWGIGTTETDSNNKYAGVPQNATTIHAKTGSPTSSDESKIGYKLVVPNTQKTGAYSGNITYTATGALN